MTSEHPVTNPVAIDHLEAQLAAYHHIDQQIKDLAAMKEKVRQTIIEAIGEHDAGTVADRVVVRSTRYVTRRLSSTLVRKHFTADQLADCYVQSAGHRLTVMAP